MNAGERKELKRELQRLYPQYRVYVRRHRGRDCVAATRGGVPVSGEAFAEFLAGAERGRDRLTRLVNLGEM